MQLTNNCPRNIDPELWDGMSGDARYQAQRETRSQAQKISVFQWALLAPPLLFILLPPVQTLVNKYAPPSHYVKLNGTADPRKFLDESVPVVGDRVAGFEVTSAFGARVHPVHGDYRQHNCIDIGTPTGTPVYAPAVGSDTVSVRCWEDAAGGGTVAEISSTSVPEWRFKALHLSQCTDGKFSAGDVIAKTGASGVGTGAHLDLRQLPANADTYVAPMRGYMEWMVSGSAGEDLIDIPALKESIIGQESGGNPSAVNADSGALGLGQIMPENLAGDGQGWDWDALGRDVSPAEFLADPKLQDEIIEHQLSAIALSQSTDSTGATRNPEEIAKRSAAVWYSGRPEYCSSTGGEVFGAGAYPSGAEYCASIGEKYQSIQQKRLEQLDK